MKLTKIYFIGLVLLWSCTLEDKDSPQPEDVFVKYYGSQMNEAIDLSTYQYSENGFDKIGFIVLARHEDNSGFSKYYIIRTDDQGNETRSIIFASDTAATASRDIPKSLKTIGNGKYIVTGYRGSGGFYDGVWFEIDTALNKPEIHVVPGIQTVDIEKTTESDESFKVILIGNNNEGKVQTSKRDRANGVVWSKVSKLSVTALSINENSNGNLLMVGTTNVDTGEGENVYILEMSPLGVPNSSGSHGALSHEYAVLAADDIPTSVIRSPTGYAVTGYTKANGDGNSTPGDASFTLTVSTSGKIEKTHIFQFPIAEGELRQCRGLGLTRHINGGYVVVGSLPNYSEGGINKQEEMMVMRINASNGYEDRLLPYSHSYGRVTGNDYASAILTMPDGDLVVAATIDFGSNVTLISLMKLDSNGALLN